MMGCVMIVGSEDIYIDERGISVSDAPGDGSAEDEPEDEDEPD
jgi:hypothetical protein